MLQGSVYAVLERLEAKGLMKSRLGEATPERGGRAKRYFTLTAEGVRHVREAQRALEAMWVGLPQNSGAKP
jgi:DNA-binding PadR family transcriptional regulator